jgi:hypothetical protein
MLLLSVARSTVRRPRPPEGDCVEVRETSERPVVSKTSRVSPAEPWTSTVSARASRQPSQALHAMCRQWPSWHARCASKGINLSGVGHDNPCPQIQSQTGGTGAQHRWAAESPMGRGQCNCRLHPVRVTASLTEETMTNHRRKQTRDTGRDDDKAERPGDTANSSGSPLPDNAAPVLQSEDEDALVDEDAP